MLPDVLALLYKKRALLLDRMVNEGLCLASCGNMIAVANQVIPDA